MMLKLREERDRLRGEVWATLFPKRFESLGRLSRIDETAERLDGAVLLQHHLEARRVVVQPLALENRVL